MDVLCVWCIEWLWIVVVVVFGYGIEIDFWYGWFCLFCG